MDEKQLNAHKFFAAGCFNGTWTLLDKKDRTADDDILMVATAHASLYHWLQRPDCTDENKSVGFWLLSRVYAVLGNAAEAQRYAELCHSASTNVSAFCSGYAHEALARAARLSGNTAEAEKHIALALSFAAAVTDPEWRKMLEGDVEGV